MKHAERLAKPRHTTPWSPELIRYCKSLCYWQLWASKLKINVDTSWKRSIITSQWDITGIPTSLQEAQDQICTARQHLSTAIDNALQLCKEFLRNKLVGYLDANNATDSKAITAILNAEA